MLDDGLMDLVAIKHIPRVRFVQTAETGKAGKIETLVDDVDYIQCSEYTLTPVKDCEGANTVNIDGELKGISPMRVKVLPRAIYFSC